MKWTYKILVSVFGIMLASTMTIVNAKENSKGNSRITVDTARRLLCPCI